MGRNDEKKVQGKEGKEATKDGRKEGRMEGRKEAIKAVTG